MASKPAIRKKAGVAAANAVNVQMHSAFVHVLSRELNAKLLEKIKTLETALELKATETASLRDLLRKDHDDHPEELECYRVFMNTALVLAVKSDCPTKREIIGTLLAHANAYSKKTAYAAACRRNDLDTAKQIAAAMENPSAMTAQAIPFFHPF